jgi:hypothetical protein
VTSEHSGRHAGWETPGRIAQALGVAQAVDDQQDGTVGACRVPRARRARPNGEHEWTSDARAADGDSLRALARLASSAITAQSLTRPRGSGFGRVCATIARARPRAGFQFGSCLRSVPRSSPCPPGSSS